MISLRKINNTFWWFALWAFLMPSLAWAQSNCPTTNSSPIFSTGGSVFGYIGPQWQSFFGAKADANNGTLCNVTINGLFTLGLTNFSVNGPITATGPVTVGNVVISSGGITIDGAEVGLTLAALTPNIVLTAFAPPSPQMIGTTIPINAVPTASYTLASTDGTQEVDLGYSSGPTSVTIPSASSSNFTSGYATTVCPLSEPSTFTPQSGLINGQASVYIPSGVCTDIRSNGVGWQASASTRIGSSLSTSNLSSCGTSPTITGTDVSGNITPGTGSPTACTITFHTGFYSTTPNCVITGVGTGSGILSIGTQSASAITVDDSTAFSGSDGFNYVCSTS